MNNRIFRKKEHDYLLQQLSVYHDFVKNHSAYLPPCIHLTQLQYAVYSEIAQRSAKVPDTQILPDSFRGIPIIAIQGRAS